MRSRHVLLSSAWMTVLAACGAPAPDAADTGSTTGDAGAPTEDAGVPNDAWAAPGSDAGSLVDAGTTPEVCTGGLDEDGDTAIDCLDPDCFAFVDCIAADVAHSSPGLVPCGDPIEIDAAASREACTMIGSPALSSYTSDCTTGSLTATARVFCDASGAPAALWLEERLSAPETQEMISARQFRLTYYERASVVDWERQSTGFGAREGGAGFPLHDTQTNATGGGTLFTVITVRTVAAGDVISRLLGMQHITSLIDLDAPMSMDTRSTGFLGGLTLTVPAP